VTLDAYEPTSAGRHGKADARQHPAISAREAEDRRHFQRQGRPRVEQAHTAVHAEIAAAQALLTALDAGEISPRLASQQIGRHLAAAKRLLGGAS
jgi:hypothetical protein